MPAFRCYCAVAVAVALVSALAATSTYSQPAEADGIRIDGSTKASLEASIARLQNELRARRRADFETALAVIWIGQTVGTGDLDRDGDVDSVDVRSLMADADDLLTEIERGNLLSAIEEREEKRTGAYTAAAFVEQLDGLGHDEVLELAGRPSNEPFLDVLGELRAGVSGAGNPSFRVPVDLCALFSGASARLPDNTVPIVRVPPRYPQTALDRRQSGAVCLEFTVAGDGTPKEIVVLGSTSTMFEQPALAAFSQWKFQPRSLAGAPVEPRRWLTQITFQL
jgi:TonB family protein